MPNESQRQKCIDGASLRITPELQRRLPRIIDRDHSLSLGCELLLASDYAGLRTRDAISPEDFASMELDAQGGCFASFERRHFDVNVIRGSLPSGETPPLIRYVEVLVHEASHAVDRMFDRARLVEIDTELRAYTLDWIVGKALHLLQPMRFDSVTPDKRGRRS